MANSVKMKRSAVDGKVPTTTDLALGEIGLNTFNGKVFILKDDGTPAIVEVGAIPAFSSITGKPTTLSGYGITDAAQWPIQTGNSGKYLTTNGTSTSWGTLSISFSSLSSIPTTLSGYGITDAASFPDQTSSSGLFLTTDGTSVLWSTFNGRLFDVRNTAIGDSALAVTTGANNTGIGYYSLKANTTGSSNTAIGGWSLLTNTTGASNVAIGTSALRLNTAGGSNVAIGSSALAANTTGGSNVAIGSSALAANTVSGGLTAVGSNALAKNTDGTYNVAVGSTALYNNTTGYGNMALGPTALYSNTIGVENVAVGSAALYYNTVGNYNAAVGSGALKVNTTGVSCTAIGYQALTANTIGTSNTAIGYQALTACTTGTTNTAVGYTALSALTTYTNATGLGNSAAVTAANQVQCGNSSTTFYAYGTYNNRSDERDKTDIRPTILGLDFISSLTPVDFKWDYRDDYKPEQPSPLPNDASDEQVVAHDAALAEWLEAVKLDNLVHDGSKKRNRYHHGLISQQVKSLLDEKQIDFGGYQDHSICGGQDVQTIGYTELIGPMIKAIQELKAEIELLKAK